MASDFVKIVFALEIDEDGFPPISSETLNARPVDEGFVLDNTPFFVEGVALGDRVAATPIERAGSYAFIQVLEPSLNKAVSVIFLDGDIKEVVYQRFRSHGCYCEFGEFGQNQELQMLAVSVPADCDYDAVVGWLGAYEASGQLSYAELAI